MESCIPLLHLSLSGVAIELCHHVDYRGSWPYIHLCYSLFSVLRG